MPLERASETEKPQAGERANKRENTKTYERVRVSGVTHEVEASQKAKRNPSSKKRAPDQETPVKQERVPPTKETREEEEEERAAWLKSSRIRERVKRCESPTSRSAPS